MLYPNQPYVQTRPMTSSQAQAGAAALARQEERSKQTKTVKPSVRISRIKTPVRTLCQSKLFFYRFYFSMLIACIMVYSAGAGFCRAGPKAIGIFQNKRSKKVFGAWVSYAVTIFLSIYTVCCYFKALLGCMISEAFSTMCFNFEFALVHFLLV